MADELQELDELLKKPSPSPLDEMGSIIFGDQPRTMGERARVKYEEKLQTDPVAKMGVQVYNMLTNTPPARMTHALLEDTSKGFNTAMANTMGFPVEVANEVMHIAGKDFLENPGNAMASVRRAFQHTGINVEDDPAKMNFLNKVGEEAFKQLLFWGGMRGAAPTMSPTASNPTLLAPAPNTLGGAIKETMGRSVIEKPVTGVVAGMASAPGVVAGREFGGPAGEVVGSAVEAATGLPLGGVVKEIVKAGSEMAGGVATGATGIKLAQTARIPWTQRRIIPENEMPGVPSVTGEPVIHTLADKTKAQVGAKSASERALEAIDNQIIRSIQRAGEITDTVTGQPYTVRPREASRWLYSSINTVKDSAKGMVDHAWDRISGAPNISPVNLFHVMDDLVSNPNHVGANIPDALVKEYFSKWTTTMPNGNVLLKDLPFEYANRLRRTIMDMRWDVGAHGRAPVPQEMRRNLQSMEDALDLDMATTFGNSPKGNYLDGWEYARHLSRQFNDRFTRGPIGELLGLTVQGQARINPEEAAEFLLKTRGGFDSVREAGAPFPRSGGRSTLMDETGKPLPTDQKLAGADELAQSGNNAIRSLFVRAAEEGAENAWGDRAATATGMARATNTFRNKTAEEIDKFTAAANQIDSAYRGAQQGLAARNNWERSAVHELGRTTTEDTVRRIMASPRPDMQARQIMQAFRGQAPGGQGVLDADAVRGLSRAMVEDLIMKAPSPDVALSRLMKPETFGAFKEVMGDHYTERLQRILMAADNMAKLQANPNILQKGGAAAANFMAHISGLWAGGAAATMFMAGQQGQLSLPARMARAMRTSVNNILNQGEPKQWMADAVFDVNTERLLRMRMPTTAEDAQTFAKMLNRIGVAHNIAYDRGVEGYMRKFHANRPREVEAPVSEPPLPWGAP